MKHFNVILAACLAAGTATAKDGPHEAMPASSDSAHMRSKATTSGTAKKVDEKKTTAGASKTAYARLLAAALRRQTPKSSQQHSGSVKVAFTVDASGRVVSHTVQYTSDKALVETVDQILASVQAPPPPGGSFSAVQEFNFH
jgi:TonB family protein